MTKTKFDALIRKVNDFLDLSMENMSVRERGIIGAGMQDLLKAVSAARKLAKKRRRLQRVGCDHGFNGNFED